MKTLVETRARLGLNFRAASDAEKSDGYIGAITGTIPYNADSAELRDRGVNRGKAFVERISPEAFKRSIQTDKDIMAVAGHTDAPLAAFARVGENLSFRATDTALEWTALIPDTQAGRDLKTLTEANIIRGTSFEFALHGDGETWEKRDGKDVRTITDARLLAVNPVAWPAYPDSELTVSMRSARSMYETDFMGECCDPTLSADQCYALDQLESELEELNSAQEYLRTNPSGALVAMATKCVTDCTAEVKALIDWISANGSVPAENPTMARAKKATEQKQAEQTTFSDEDRERRLRFLKLSSI